jgi:type I restriction enzyme S subunit
MVGWITRPLSDFVDPDRSICYGIIQPGSPVAEGVPIVRVNNFAEGRVNTTDALRVDAEIEAKYKRSRLQGGELLITLVGSMGLSAIAPDELRGWNVARAVGVVPLRPEADKRWINFVIRSQPSQDFIRLRANTTVQATFNLKDLAELPVPCPPDPVRAEMSAVLSSLDDKIELNRRMNETLEAMARAIFKDWFVDFGPTRAKMEGRAPYLAPDIWSLFPDRLDDEGKPEGWITSTIGQEVEVLGGSTPSTKEPAFWGGDIAWATPKDLSSLSTPVLLGTERQITEAGLSQIGSGLLPAGTVLLSSRAPIGYMAIAQIPVAVNQGFIAMICNKRLSNVFVWLWTQANMETVHQNANGSTFQEISKANFRPIEVTVATPELLRAFDETARPLFDRIVANEKENLTLATTRDFLLPKLMSGEVRVGDATSSA